MKSKDLIIESLFNAPIEQVWKAITEKDLMKQWYFDLEEFKPEVGFKFQFTGGPSPEKQYLHLCEITEVIPNQKLSYTWRYDSYEGNSLVLFELFEESSKTLLKLTHSGLESFPKTNPDLAIHNFEEGWNSIINVGLKEFLEANYSNSLFIKSEAEKVYGAITNHISDWWSEDYSGISNNLNDKFTVRFGTTFKTMKVTELIPNEKVVWICIDTLIDIPELPNNTEWKDTRIVWELQKDDDNTKITLTHIGLTSELKCYTICEQGWKSFLESLKQFTETNIGLPFKKD